MLNKQHRFHGHNALTFAYKQGTTIRGGSLYLKYAHNQRRRTYRAAVIVSKKVSKSAVVRNRIRRRVYAALARHQNNITGSYDLLFTVNNPDVATMPAPQLQQTVAQQLTKAGVVV